MASIPSLAVSGAVHHKVEPEIRKSSLNNQFQEKNVPYPRTTVLSDTLSEVSSVTDNARVFDTSFYAPLLHECASLQSLRAAETLHGHTIKTGMDNDVFVSTYLINIYMRCGDTEHAQNLFDGLPQRNVVTWTALVSGYVHNAQPGYAAEVFVEMLGEGRYPTNYTLGAILSACCALYSLELGRQVHGYIIKYQLEHDTSMGNSICSLYAKCCDLESSVKAFRRIREKNVISWTTVISACGDNAETERGLSFFLEMLLENAEPNEFTLTSTLSLCCTSQNLYLGKQVHAMCIKFGCDSSVPVKNSIMYLYLKSGEIKDARRLLDSMASVSLITWNAVIAGHAQLMDLAKDDVSLIKNGMEAFKIFHNLNRSGLKPDLFSFSSILTVCSGLVALEQGEQIHAQTIKSGYLSDVVVSSALVNMYNKCGCIEEAAKAFEDMSNRTMISWTSMITGYSQYGRSKEALQLFEDMRQAAVRPNEVTFVGVLSACSHGGMVKEAQYYFNLMKNEYRIKPVMDHYACMIDMYVRLGRLDDAFDFINKMNFEPNEIIWSILIAGCRSQGKMDLAYYAAENLLKLKPKSIETYVLLMNMYLSAERWQDVSRVRKLMKDENIGSVRDRSWINIKDRTYSFKADDKSHFQSSVMYGILEDLLARAKGLGYVPYKSIDVSDEEDEQKHSGTTIHHSERIAIAFGLLYLPRGVSVRVVKNISMCRDCHNAIKYFSVLTERDIIVRDSKRLHKFSKGQCSCGDFGALL